VGLGQQAHRGGGGQRREGGGVHGERGCPVQPLGQAIQ
jgi:hypothetical protein